MISRRQRHRIGRRLKVCTTWIRARTRSARVDAGWFGTDEGTLPHQRTVSSRTRSAAPSPARVGGGEDPLGRPARSDHRAASRDDAGAASRSRRALAASSTPGSPTSTIFAARGVPISVFDLHDRGDLRAGQRRGGAARRARARDRPPGPPAASVKLRVLCTRARPTCFLAAGGRRPDARRLPASRGYRDARRLVPPGFVRGQAPQLLARAPSAAHALPAASTRTSLDHSRPSTRRSTTWRACDYADACSSRAPPAAPASTPWPARRCAGARATGLVSTQAKGRLVSRAARPTAYVNRTDPALAAAFVPDALRCGPAGRAWLSAGRTAGYQALDAADRNEGQRSPTWSCPRWARISSRASGRSPRAPSGRRLVFYGATSGYTLAFTRQAGRSAAAREMLRRARTCGRTARRAASATGMDAAGRRPGWACDAISAAALRSGARVAVAPRAPNARRPPTRPSRPTACAGVVQPGRRWRRAAGFPLARRHARLRRGPRIATATLAYRDPRAQALRPGGRARAGSTPRTTRAAIPDAAVVEPRRPGHPRRRARSWRDPFHQASWSIAEATSDDRRLLVLRAQRCGCLKRVLFPDLRDPRRHLLQRPAGRGGGPPPRRAGALTPRAPATAVRVQDARAGYQPGDPHENRHAGTIDGGRSGADARSTRRGPRARSTGVGLASSTTGRCACGSIPVRAGARRTRVWRW